MILPDEHACIGIGRPFDSLRPRYIFVRVKYIYLKFENMMTAVNQTTRTTAQNSYLNRSRWNEVIWSDGWQNTARVDNFRNTDWII